VDERVELVVGVEYADKERLETLAAASNMTVSKFVRQHIVTLLTGETWPREIEELAKIKSLVADYVRAVMRWHDGDARVVDGLKRLDDQVKALGDMWWHQGYGTKDAPDIRK
jgi:hypothetical protein